MKKGVLALTLSVLFLLPLISAQFGFGYGFSLSNLFDSFVNSSTSVYLLLFFLMFILLMLAASRVKLFRNAYGQPNGIAAGGVAFSISALAIYYLYQSGFQGESLFSWLGFSEGALSAFALILVVVAAVLVIWKLRFKGFFLIFGLLLILIASFTEIIYERGLAWVIGLVFLLIGLFLGSRARGYLGSAGKWAGSQTMAGVRKKPMWAVTIVGIILAVGGFYFGQVIIAVIGVILILIGVNGKRAYGGYKGALVKGYGLSGLGTAYSAAQRQDVREEAERAASEASRINMRTRQLQDAYNHYKSINQDPNAPANVRGDAYNGMRQVAAEAARERIQLRY